MAHIDGSVVSGMQVFDSLTSANIQAILERATSSLIPKDRPVFSIVSRGLRPMCRISPKAGPKTRIGDAKALYVLAILSPFNLFK